MKKLIRALVGLVSLALVVSPGLAADFKVGFVDASKVLEQAPQAEDARVRLEREFAPRDRTLVSTQKEIRRLEDKVVRDGAIMSDKERAGVERELRAKKRELKRQQDEFRDDLNLRRNEELQKLQRKVLDTIHTLAKRDKYDLIVSDGVIFASKRVDVTAKVVELLNKEFKSKKK